VSTTMVASPSGVPLVPAQQLRPYKSVLVLAFDLNDFDAAMSSLRRKLAQLIVSTRGSQQVEVIADGVSDDVIAQMRFDLDDGESLGVDAILSAHILQPSWAAKDFEYRDIVHRLCIWTGRINLVAISCDGALEEKMQRWLDSSPAPMFRRVSPGVLNAALLSGEARGLWLRATHGHRRTKADSKTLSGQSLREALTPIEDSTYAMGSARAELLPDPLYSALSGVVGVTPRRAKVWLQSSESLFDYVSSIRDLLRVLAACIDAGMSDDAPFPWLAAEVHDLSLVSGAYELTWCALEDLPATDVTPDVEAAAEVLARASVIVRGAPGSANFELDVGLDGRLGGTLGCVVSYSAGAATLNFGFRGAQSDPAVARQVQDALSGSQMLTVHYESGHAITHNAIWSARLQDAEFPGWQWFDYTGYDVCREKPFSRIPQDIHDSIAGPGEASLFSWVVSEFGGRGYLTCDDGANEVADFVLVDGNDELTLIHVKAAGSPNPARGISASKFEVVASQAVKNLRYLDHRTLVGALESSPVPRPAVWLYGKRETDRTNLLAHLRLRSPRAPSRVMVVQPHITQTARAAALAVPNAVAGRRLRLAETLLNGARGAAVASGCDLTVGGSV
jgi:hypothetical protein